VPCAKTTLDLPLLLESDNDDRHDDGSSPDVSSDDDSLSDVQPDDPVYNPSGGVHTVTVAPSTSTQRSTCDAPVTVDRHWMTKQLRQLQSVSLSSHFI